MNWKRFALLGLALPGLAYCAVAFPLAALLDPPTWVVVVAGLTAWSVVAAVLARWEANRS